MTNPETIKQILLDEIEKMNQHRKISADILELILHATGKLLSTRSSISKSPWKAAPSTLSGTI